MGTTPVAVNNTNVKIVRLMAFWSQAVVTQKSNKSKSLMTTMNVQACAAYNVFSE